VNAGEELALFARVVGSLVVVVVLAVLAARVTRRTGVRGGGAGLQVVERAGLTREASVAVVEVAGRGLVVGVTAQGVALLTELEPGALEAYRPQQDAARAKPGRPVRAVAPAGPAGSGSPLDPRTWKQGVEALRDLTARRR
jgi:flagellar biogenesis protein FliO